MVWVLPALDWGLRSIWMCLTPYYCVAMQQASHLPVIHTSFTRVTQLEDVERAVVEASEPGEVERAA